MSRAWNKAYGVDPDILIRDEDRKSIEEKYFAFAYDRAGHHSPHAIRPSLWIWVVPVLASAMVLAAGPVAVLLFGWPTWSLGFFLLGAAFCGFLGTRWIAREHFGPLFRRELNLRGDEICVHCGYWLRGLNDNAKNCPECGKSRTVPIHPA